MMITYKLFLGDEQKPVSVKRSDGWSIPLTDLANTDYANFKREILADEAQLQDADGNLMTPQDAKAFLVTLP